MRALTREFSASTQDDKGNSCGACACSPGHSIAMRAPIPISQTVPCSPLVTSAGTDPEALAGLGGAKAGSRSRPGLAFRRGARFCQDLNLWVRHKGSEVFTAPLIPYGSPCFSKIPSTAIA